MAPSVVSDDEETGAAAREKDFPSFCFPALVLTSFHLTVSHRSAQTFNFELARHG